MKIYKNGNTGYIQYGTATFRMEIPDWDTFLNREDLRNQIIEELKSYSPLEITFDTSGPFDPPMGNQEIWAAGVTYLRSKVEREKESERSGGSVFYDKVYEAKRPELFFKANVHRTVGSGHKLNIRRDSEWNVPEPELTLYVNSNGNIQAYTIGNDLSSRSIEGENPLYLPQAKTWNKCAAIGPCLYLPESPLSVNTTIALDILRNGTSVFHDNTSLSKMKREFGELISFLFSESDFPIGCFLMTGTGVVPPQEFTLKVGDEIRISIDSIGTLTNMISVRS